MSWRERLDEALDRAQPGPLTVEGPRGGHADLEVHRADAIGVRVGRVRLRHEGPRDVAVEAERLGRELRALPDRVAPVEVDPTLGGAVLRSRPEEMRRASHPRSGCGRPMIAGSLNRLNRKGLTASRLSGPPRLNRTTPIRLTRAAP